MSITSILRDSPNNVSIVRITADNTIAEIAQPNYIAQQQAIIEIINKGPWQWFETDTLLVSANDANGFFAFTDTTFSTVVLIAGSTDGVITPGLANQIAYYPSGGNTLAGTSVLPSLVQINPVNINNGLNASAATFYSGDGTWKALPDSQYSVYVSPDGSNTTGTGSVTNPYQTITKALSTITTNNSTHIFNIILAGGIYNETSQIKLKPWVNLVGTSINTIINNSSAIILDPTWNTSTDSVCSIQNLKIQNDMTLDFNDTSVSGADGPVIKIINIEGLGINTLNGNAVNPCIFFLYSSYFIEMHINNAIFETFSNYYLSSFTGGTSAFVAPLFLFSNNDFYNSTVALFGNTSGPIIHTYNIKNSSLNGTLTITGNNAILNVDLPSFITPTILSSATVNLVSISNGLNANYVPTNYSVLAPDVNAHLVGIDNALGSLVSEGLIWNEVTGTSQAAAINNAYITNNAGLVTVTLPATAALGSRVAIQGKGAGGWSMVANAGQTIHVGNTASSVAGSVSSTNQWDAIEIVCVTANTTWAVRSIIGNLTVA